jgi:uncharacterized protein YfaS (alpha-2-macroglobulin family)
MEPFGNDMKRFGFTFFYWIIAWQLLTSFALAAIGSDKNSLEVVQTVPVENAGEVSTTQSIVVHFSREVNQQTLNAFTFSVEEAAGTLRYDPVFKSATWTPFLPLEPGRTYTVNVSDEIKDLDGRPLSFSYSWTFTTSAIKESSEEPDLQEAVPVAI